MKVLSTVFLAMVLAAGAQAQDAPSDTVSALDMLDKLKKSDKDFFIQDIWEFDLEWEDSLRTALDSVGLDEFKDQAGKKMKRFRYSFSLNEHTLAYNRVEGFVPGVSVGLQFGRGRPVRFHAEGGYATASKKVRYDGSLVWRTGKFGFRGEYGDRVTPFGSNRVHGNSVRAFVGGSDDQDYLRQTGGRIGAGASGNKWSISGAYGVHRERSQPARTEFALFGKMRAPNPEISEGTDRHAYFRGHLGSYSRDQIRLDASHRISGGALGGDFTYNRADLDFRARRYVVSGHELTLRVRGAATTRSAPVQRKADVGGLETVRGFVRRSRVGNQSAAGRVEYLVPYDIFRRARIPVLQSAGLQFVPWADAARVWEGGNDTWLTSAGLGIQIFLVPFRYISYLRLDVAIPMGPDRLDDARVFLRFAERNF